MDVVMFRQLFTSPKPIIGVIHLPALPGYPDSPGLDAVLDKAVNDLSALERGGVDGVLVENFADAGSVVWSREMQKGWRVPVYRTKPIDTTGAGDAFCGAFCATYSRTRDPRAAAVSGTVAASFVIEGFGGLHAIDTPFSAVERRFDDVNQRVEVLSAERGEA